ncbi:MAG: high frequency lysogenization protein HflD [Pseudohongiellaceae bacterium]
MNNFSNKFDRMEYQYIALAAVAQCTFLVHRLASRGSASDDEMVACVNPLLVMNPGTVADVYPFVSRLGLGLQTLQDMFSNEKMRENSNVIRYTLGVLELSRRVMINKPVQSALRRELQLLDPLTDDADHATSDAFYQQAAGIYQRTISTLPFRVQVQGNVEYLKDDHVADRIRTLLLAGIRSAVLWSQLGGRRWHLVVYRKKIKDCVTRIRRSLISTL